jgi:predicted transcriptional regulator
MTAERIDGQTLQRQLIVRGMCASDLAKLAHISPPTVSQAIHGRPVSARTVAAIVRALAKTEPIPGAVELLADKGIDVGELP